MNERIIIVSGFPLSRNPRVVKEATVLADAGYDVEVLTSIFNPAIAEHETAIAEGQKWRALYIVDNRRTDIVTRARWDYLRVRRKLWDVIYRGTSIGNVRQFAYCAPELFRYCLSANADLYSVHLQPALWVGVQLLKLGRRVGVDFEDWYSEDCSDKNQSLRPRYLLKQWESFLAQRASYSLTTSHSLAQQLAQAYRAPEPKVVYNAFPLQERQSIDDQQIDRFDDRHVSICWFSQTIGSGRGLEDLMSALHIVTIPVEIHLRGECSNAYKHYLLSLAPPVVRDRVFFHDFLQHGKLLSRIAEHDIGFAGETGFCANNKLTIANKVFQYFLAGLPVIASATPGHKEVHVEAPGAMQLFLSGDVKSLARAIDRWGDKLKRQNAAEAALAAAKVCFNWDSSAAIIRSAVSQALSS